MKRRPSRRGVDLDTRIAPPPVLTSQVAPRTSGGANVTLSGLDTAARRLLERAGSPMSVHRLRLHTALGACSAAALALGVALLASPLGLSLSAVASVVFVIGSGVIGGGAPLMHLRSLARTRAEAIERDLPDALDLLALATGAGLAMDAAIARVADATRDPIRQELHRWRSDVTLGVPRGRALREMAQRTGVRQIGSWAAAMAQAESTGSPLADVLRSQATTQREHRALRAEERAQQLPVTMVVPLILCVLPALLIIVIGPAVLSIASSGALP